MVDGVRKRSVVAGLVLVVFAMGGCSSGDGTSNPAPDAAPEVAEAVDGGDAELGAPGVACEVGDPIDEAGAPVILSGVNDNDAVIASAVVSYRVDGVEGDRTVLVEQWAAGEEIRLGSAVPEGAPTVDGLCEVTGVAVQPRGGNGTLDGAKGTCTVSGDGLDVSVDVADVPDRPVDEDLVVAVAVRADGTRVLSPALLVPAGQTTAAGGGILIADGDVTCEVLDVRVV